MRKAVEFDEAAKVRIKQESEREIKLRIAAYLPVITDVGGIKLRQMTLGDVVECDYAENKLIIGGLPDATDYAHFFWLLRPKGTQQNEKEYIADCRRKWKNESVRNAVATYIENQFMDAPAGNSSSASGQIDSKLWINPMLDTFASEYGWTVEHIFSQPIARLFQLTKYIYFRRSKGKIPITSPLTQEAKQQELRRMQQYG